jgi:hypothetical protein
MSRPEKVRMVPEKGIRAKYMLRTLLFRFLQGTHAEEMHRLFFGSSLPASLFPLRPFFAGASVGVACDSALISIAAVKSLGGLPDAKCGVWMAGGVRALTGDSPQVSATLISVESLSSVAVQDSETDTQHGWPSTTRAAITMRQDGSRIGTGENELRAGVRPKILAITCIVIGSSS